MVRAREDAKGDLLRARHRLSKFLLRHGCMRRKACGIGHGNIVDGSIAFILKIGPYSSCFKNTYITWMKLMSVLEEEIHEQATESAHVPVIQAFQTLRGVAEIGQFSRFSNPRQLMAYTGPVPREYSSGTSRWQGGSTKTGNAHVRRVLIEAAWNYRYKPALKGEIRRRQQGKSPEVQAVAWKAQNRLHRKYMKCMARGKSAPVSVTAVARE
ncbi:transposase [Aneurinibacillus migulanus]|uniref:transposase n=1 Tax=Aneurinibacillus migulanus TaxID=47500 RepID=UPI000A52863F|nr:transposase [Aneurinibacillus migulanus]MCP1359338.1 transposase [Aneurinibacillus migulanus]